LTEVTPQEEQLLNSLVERVNQTQLQEKDPDAEGLLNRSLGVNPDALYILAQTVLVQNIALEQAKAQVAQLQQQVAQARQQPQPSRATSFLGGLLGHHEGTPQQQATQQQGYTPVAQAQPAYGRLRPDFNHRGISRWRSRDTPRVLSRPMYRPGNRSLCRWEVGSRAFCAAPCRRQRAWQRERWRLKVLRPCCMESAGWAIRDLAGVVLAPGLAGE